MKARSAYEIWQAMKAEAQALEDITKGRDVHPDTFRRVVEMQQERVPCLFCGATTKTDVHVDYRGGISVYTLYKCPKCTHEFMEKDLHEPKD